MLGSIEELEKDIELFRNNVAASNELCALLEQVVSQIKQQNADFTRESAEVLSKLDGIPSSIDAANNASNAEIKKGVADEVEHAIHDFSAEQDKYVQMLEQVRQQIQLYTEQANSSTQDFKAKAVELSEKIDRVVAQIKDDTKTSLNEHRATIDADIEKRNHQFADIQQQYTAELQETRGKLNSCEEQLLSKYKEFVQTLENTNLANIYEQNQKLQAELNKRTTVLMVISAISIILGIVGLFLR